MIVQFVDTQGRPVVDAIVCVVESPQAFPDLGMMTNEAGEIDIEVPATGQYGFSIHHHGQTRRVTTTIRASDARALVLFG